MVAGKANPGEEECGNGDGVLKREIGIIANV